MRKCLFCSRQDENEVFTCHNHSEEVYNFDAVAFWVPNHKQFYVRIEDDILVVGHQIGLAITRIYIGKYINQSYQELVNLAIRCIKHKAFI